MKAIFTAPDSKEKFIIKETCIPVQAPHQALIKVEAFSLNQGETRTALDATSSYVPGWDFAGTIVAEAPDGSTLRDGTSVFGFVPQGSWAEYVVAPQNLMAEIPEGVSVAEAATLAVAGVTAYMCTDLAGSMAGRKVLITGASGGVGRFICQIAAAAGAKVFVLSRRTNFNQLLLEDNIIPEGIFVSMAEARAAGQYDIILDSVGGDTLGLALAALTQSGICVNFGNSSRQPTTFNVRSTDWPFSRKQCIWVGREMPENCSEILQHLAALVKTRQLRPSIDALLPWTEIAEASERLLGQMVNGKIVLSVA